MGFLQQPGPQDICPVLHLGESPTCLDVVLQIASCICACAACYGGSASHSHASSRRQPIHLCCLQGVFNVFLGAMLVSHCSHLLIPATQRKPGKTCLLRLPSRLDSDVSVRQC